MQIEYSKKSSCLSKETTIYNLQTFKTKTKIITYGAVRRTLMNLQAQTLVNSTETYITQFSSLNSYIIKKLILMY